MLYVRYISVEKTNKIFNSKMLTWVGGKAEILEEGICLVSSKPLLVGDSVFHPAFSKRTFAWFWIRGWWRGRPLLLGVPGSELSTSYFPKLPMFPSEPTGTVTVPTPKASVAKETIWLEWWFQLGGVLGQACWLAGAGTARVHLWGQLGHLFWACVVTNTVHILSKWRKSIMRTVPFETETGL